MIRFLALYVCIAAMLVAALPPLADAATFIPSGQVTGGRAIAVDATGRSYVAESNGFIARISVFDASGALVDRFGTSGMGDGQFANAPVALAIDGQQRLYVAEASTGRINVFQLDGTYLRRWTPGGATSALAATSTGTVYAGFSSTVESYDTNGTLLATWDRSASGPGQLQGINDIEATSDGSVLVADSFTGIHRFLADGTHVRRLPDSLGLMEPSVASTSDDVFVLAGIASESRFTVQRRPIDDGAVAASLPRSEMNARGEDLVATGTKVLVLQDTGVLSFDLRAPTARITGPSTFALTGRSYQLDATGSSVPLGAITSYRWDLDGDGSYETATGASGTVSVTPSSPGDARHGVQVVAANGTIAAASITVDVRRAPPDTPVGISIERGAQFTRTPRVTLAPSWPAGATELIVSNDGGFANAQRFAVADQVDWTLDSSGPERLPKVVYVRFVGAGDPDRTFQDDIILDETAPSLRVTSATVADHDRARRPAPPRRTYSIATVARDAGSGVSGIQVTSNRARPGAWTRYRRTVTFRSRAGSAWVRVRDRAGNASSWRRVRLAP